MATISKSVTVADGGTYSIMLNAIPNGKTVTPVNDIQTWLHCADIWDKNYTTLDQVFADAPTLQALIASNNAADYMVRSHTWAKSDLVPAMTSNTTPSGVASASGEYTTGGELMSAYKAFDGDKTKTTGWSGTASTNQWVQYEFPTAKKIYSFDYRASKPGSFVTLKNFKLQGSNDGTNFVNLTDTLTNPSNDILVHNAKTTINNNTAYKYVRVFVDNTYNTNTYCGLGYLQFHSKTVVDDSTAMSYIGANDYCSNVLLADSTWCEAICNSEYFESVLNVKVPTMTSNTAPSGRAFANEESYTAAYLAFDGTQTTRWTRGGQTLPVWCAYEFPSSVCVKCIKVRFGADGIASNTSTTFKIQASSTGSSLLADWTDLTDALTSTTNTFDKYLCVNNSNKYKYYRVYITAQTTSATYKGQVGELNFYGRA